MIEATRFTPVRSFLLSTLFVRLSTCQPSMTAPCPLFKLPVQKIFTKSCIVATETRLSLETCTLRLAGTSGQTETNQMLGLSQDTRISSWDHSH